MQSNAPKARDYQKELDAILLQLAPVSADATQERAAAHPRKKPTLLLHACCAPCSSYVIEYLSRHFAITIFYYNPNIHPRTEYERRLGELRRFLAEFPPALQDAVQLVVADYDAEDYFAATNVRKETELQTEPERGERCRRCYEFRMRRAYAYAGTHGFDWFTTTLSISPHKDADKINAIGEALQESGTTRFLPANFKKRGGFLRSTQLSAEYGLWRQDYCGCVFSMQQRKTPATAPTAQKRAERAARYKLDGSCNCCQAVVKAYDDALPVDEAALHQLAAGFAAGMGCMEATCGALVGACMVAGLRTGGAGTVPISRRIHAHFKGLSGATICKELKGAGTGTPLCACEDCVRNAVLALEAVLSAAT